MTIRIGLTGPIGCGKSTIAGWLGERPGVLVIDADVVAREVVEPGQPALEAVLTRFGEGLRRHDGSLDRAALGRIVFEDDKALRDLEAIVHPAVRLRILSAINDAEVAGEAVVVIEAIKLVEGGLAEVCDQVWLVTCDQTTQAARLIARGSAPEDAARRIAAQAGFEDRVRPRATRVIDSSGGIDATRAIVDRIWETP
jgi:dephospho-CoA kinase